MKSNPEIKKSKDDIFFQVQRENVQTSEGEIQLPILYYDVNLVLVFYYVEPERVQKVLENTKLEPLVFYNGKSLVVLALFEYKDTTVGIYNEVGIGIGVQEQNKKVHFPLFHLLRLLLRKQPETIPIGFFIQHLPVTTSIANAAGREIWGYPKFVTDIPYRMDLNTNQFYGAVKDPEENSYIFELEGNLKKNFSIPAFDLITYTILENRLIRTIINVNGKLHVSFQKDFHLKNVDSQHPMALDIRSLGLERTNSYMVLYSNHWQSRLNSGTIVPDV